MDTSGNTSAQYAPRRCWVPVPEMPGDVDNRDNCQLTPGHPGEHVGEARWRVGRKVGRTIYLTGYDATDDDELIGVMDTPELAAFVVDAVNARLASGAPK